MKLHRSILSLFIFTLLIHGLPAAYADRGPGGHSASHERGHEARYSGKHWTRPLVRIQKELMFFYRNGHFYRHTPAGYVVVPAPAGAVIPALPSGCPAVMINGQMYYVCQNVYYAAVSNGYQVTPVNMIQTAQPVIY